MYRENGIVLQLELSAFLSPVPSATMHYIMLPFFFNTKQPVVGLIWPLVPKIPGSLPTEAVGFFLLEKATACSTIRYKRQLKVQYQDNEAQDTAKKKSNATEVCACVCVCVQ
jgi:hypothetical protein